MTTATIDKIVIFVEVEGRAYRVNLPQERLQIIMHIAGGLGDNGALPLAPTDDIKFYAKEPA